MTPRQTLNIEILHLLGTYLEKNPDIRFGQALVDLNVLKYRSIDNGMNIKISDPYHEEPLDTLNRMTAKQKPEVNSEGTSIHDRYRNE